MDEISEIEEWIEAVLDALQEILESGGRISDELAGEIADAIQEEQNYADQLRERLANPPELGAAPPPDAELLWILAGQDETAFMQYLREYPSPATQSLLANPTELFRVIEYLNRTHPPGEQPVVDGIQKSDLQSSNIWGTKYDPRSQRMTVRFQGGAEYEYDGIPAAIYRAVMRGNASAKTRGKNRYGEWWPQKNPSLGAALNQYVKAANFPYRRVA